MRVLTFLLLLFKARLTKCLLCSSFINHNNDNSNNSKNPSTTLIKSQVNKGHSVPAGLVSGGRLGHQQPLRPGGPGGSHSVCAGQPGHTDGLSEPGGPSQQSLAGGSGVREEPLIPVLLLLYPEATAEFAV